MKGDNRGNLRSNGTVSFGYPLHPNFYGSNFASDSHRSHHLGHNQKHGEVEYVHPPSLTVGRKPVTVCCTSITSRFSFSTSFTWYFESHHVKSANNRRMKKGEQGEI